MGWDNLGIYEMEVIDAVCCYLSSQGYRITKKVNKVTDKGNDIEAIAPNGSTLCIEAKGETSSKKNSARYNKEFSKKQKYDHVSKALFKALTYISCNKVGGIALPGDEVHRDIVKEVEVVVRTLGIRVFFVDSKTKKVSEM